MNNLQFDISTIEAEIADLEHKINEESCNSCLTDLQVGILIGLTRAYNMSMRRECQDRVFDASAPFRKAVGDYGYIRSIKTEDAKLWNMLRYKCLTNTYQSRIKELKALLINLKAQQRLKVVEALKLK